jgi:hypothetical protein
MYNKLYNKFLLKLTLKYSLQVLNKLCKTMKNYLLMHTKIYLLIEKTYII